MSRKGLIILIVIVVLALGLEVAVRFSGSVRSGVQIVNQASTAMENLVVSFDGSEVVVGTVPHR